MSGNNLCNWTEWPAEWTSFKLMTCDPAWTLLALLTFKNHGWSEKEAWSHISNTATTQLCLTDTKLFLSTDWWSQYYIFIIWEGRVILTCDCKHHKLVFDLHGPGLPVCIQFAGRRYALTEHWWCHRDESPSEHDGWFLSSSFVIYQPVLSSQIKKYVFTARNLLVIYTLTELSGLIVA